MYIFRKSTFFNLILKSIKIRTSRDSNFIVPVNGCLLPGMTYFAAWLYNESITEYVTNVVGVASSKKYGARTIVLVMSNHTITLASHKDTDAAACGLGVCQCTHNFGVDVAS